MSNGGQGGWGPGDPRNNKSHLRLLIGLMALVFTAAIVALVGEMALDNPTIREVGFWIAILGGIAYFSVRVYGRFKIKQWEEEQVRRKLARDPEPDDTRQEEDTDDRDARR